MFFKKTPPLEILTCFPTSQVHPLDILHFFFGGSHANQPCFDGLLDDGFLTGNMGMPAWPPPGTELLLNFDGEHS